MAETRNDYEKVETDDELEAGYFNAIGRLLSESFETEAQNRYAILYDSDVTEFISGETDNWIAGFEILTDSGDYDSGNSNCYYENDIGLIFADLYDDFEDASISVVNWTTAVTGNGVVSEAGGELLLSVGGTPASGSASAYTKGTGGFDAKSADGSFLIHFKHDTGSGHMLWRLRITDETNVVNILSEAASNRDRWYEFYFDVSAEIVYYRYREDKTASDNWNTWSQKDISSLTGSSWYVELQMENNPSDPGNTTDNLHCEACYYVQGSTTKYFQSNPYDHYSTGTNYPGEVIACDRAIFTANKELQGATPTWTISCDDGSNFESVSEDSLNEITNTGGNIILRGSIETSADKIAYIYEYGVKGIDWD